MRIIALVYGILLLVCATLFTACFRGKEAVIIENNFDSLTLTDFVEPDFPFITVPLDLQRLGKAFPDTNVVARGLAIQLGNKAYACFDMDLLRWSVVWTGEFLSMVLPAQVSYHDFFEKNNNEIPHILGQPILVTGIYAGCSMGRPAFHDVRPALQDVEGMSWGPIPEKVGRWEGVHVYNNRAVLTYRIGNVEIAELPGAVPTTNGIVFTRTLRIAPSKEQLFLQVAEVSDGQTAQANGKYGYIEHEGSPDSVTAVGIAGDTESTVQVFQNRYLVAAVPPSDTEREFTVAVWKGSAAAGNVFEAQLEKYRYSIPAYRKGGNQRWKDHVVTQGQLSPDTAAFVTDVLTLPLPNPWARNFRVADIAFFEDGRAAVSTFEGDVWIVSGIDKRLNRLKWQRFASGLYEPMSVEIIDNEVFVYGKEGIVRLQDLNADGEADYYENFSNLMNQSIGTREWAADMVADKSGNFYIAKGGHITGYKGVEPLLSENGKKTNWRSSSIHSGTLMKISRDGREAEVWATGLRMPYIGLNRDNSFLSASDQQGNFVPATPIYGVNRGDYFGVPLTLHRGDEPEIRKPITWIPHRVDRSGISQTWISSKHMGQLNGQMVHFSFGRPGIFRVLIDTVREVLQGGVTFIDTYYPAPVMKGEVHPKDGMLYVSGFNNYASNSTGISALTRLRYTGKPSYLLAGFQAGKEGIILSFDSKLNAAAATDIANYRVKRWNYKRTEQYGSGHYKSDGTAGEDVLPVLGAYLSADGKQVLLLVPDMKVIDQVEVLYDIAAQDGKPIDDGFWFSLHHAQELPYDKLGFQHVDLGLLDLSREEMEAMIKSDEPVTVDRGRELFAKTGCLGCHSTGRKTDGMYGPPFQGLYGSKVELTDGSVVTVDDAYLRESILEPAEKVVKGYNAEMPSYKGVLSDSDIESIIFYIKTLYR